MARTRQDVWGLGDDWNDTLLWYARAVGAMKARPIANPTSWMFLGAMHGIHGPTWAKWGFVDNQTQPPPADVMQRFWNQCQHQSWYFLPWHRGYLSAFESIVRKAIGDLGGPADTWALPYWNYNNAAIARAAELHPVFSSPDWPDGQGDNPLFEPRRYGAENQVGPITLAPEDIDLSALHDQLRFVGAPGGVPQGFGGVATIFNHSGGPNGGIEESPHNGVHGAVGGQDPAMPFPPLPNGQTDPANFGLMSWPPSAALDPIFWLHHANIDRLWEVWVGLAKNPADPEIHTNSTDAAWLTGPTRAFVMPTVDENDQQGWVFESKDVLDTQAQPLDYVYEDVSDPTPGVSPAAMRVARIVGAAPSLVEPPMAETPAETIGANDGAVRLGGGSVTARVQLDQQGVASVAGSFDRAKAAVPSAPDRVFLKLENIRGAVDPAAFDVYVGLPADADPRDHPDSRAGRVTMFGLRTASLEDGPQAGAGLTKVLEISNIVDRLHLAEGFDLAHLDVRFVPHRDVPESDPITVGRVSILRQGG